jgi:hypothetical protein
LGRVSRDAVATAIEETFGEVAVVEERTVRRDLAAEDLLDVHWEDDLPGTYVMYESSSTDSLETN